MNDDRVEGNWKILTGKIREQWGKLTDDDVDQAEGQWEQLVGKIQSRYGHAKDAAEKEVALFRAQHERGDDQAASA